jgi:hypothetical protein
MSIGLYVKYPLFMSDFNATWVFLIFKTSNIKFHENPSSGIGVVPYRQKDMTMLRVAFCKSTNKCVVHMYLQPQMCVWDHLKSHLDRSQTEEYVH